MGTVWVVMGWNVTLTRKVAQALRAEVCKTTSVKGILESNESILRMSACLQITEQLGAKMAGQSAVDK